MKQYGLIGEKLGHSLSVPIHEAIWEKISLEASYRLIEIPRGELAAVVPELLRTLDGFNITVPYKTDVMPLLDEITPFAREVGAVNTVLTGEKSRTVSVIVGSQLAYVLNRFKFPGNGFIRNLYTIAALLPAVAMQVTVYQIMSDLHLVNSLGGYIIMSCGTDVISMYIFIQFMENIPISLDESAIIDGANYWQIYWKIMLPLLKPAIVTSCILKGVGVYNEYYAANLYLMRKEIRTMALSLYTFVGPMGSKYNLICAGVIISLLPALIVFVCCQKQIYSGITAGAVKG